MNNKNTRERILQIAVRQFAAKTFAGARIEEIAREAGIPKSLIYYHFKGKEEILATLIRDFQDAWLRLLPAYPNKEGTPHAYGMKERMGSVYHAFGQQHADLVRVLLVESLRLDNPLPALFDMVDAMIRQEAGFGSLSDEQCHQRRIVEFYTSFIPNLAYLCFADGWARHFGMERPTFDRMYLNAYDETHGAWHRHHDVHTEKATGAALPATGKEG